MSAEPKDLPELLDSWTAQRAAVGLVFGLAGVGAIASVLASVGWLMVRDDVRKNVPQLFPPHERQGDVDHAIVDLVVFVLARGVGSSLRKE